MTEKQEKEVTRLSNKINVLLNEGGASLSEINRLRRKLNALYTEIQRN